MSDAKWEKIGTIAYLILMVIYGVLMMILSIQAYTQFSDSTEAYLSLANNLGSNFITDIQISNTKCPQDYSTIFDWDWLGTYQGCNCARSTYLNHVNVYVGSCNSTELYRGCVNIKEGSAVFFDAIKGGSNNKQLVCTKRGNVKFSDIIANQTGSCSSSQKLCGNPMNKGTIICVDASESCPIYGFHKSSLQDLTTYPSSEWRELSLDTGEYLYVDVNGSTSDSLPLSEIRFTQVGVCKIENTAKTIPNGMSDYVLMKTERNGCEESDDSFKRTNLQIAENQYYEINMPASQWETMKNWPNMVIQNSEVPFESFSRPFINWKIEFRSLVKGFVDSKESIENVRTAQLTVLIINVIACILISVILSLFQVYNLCGYDVPCIPGAGITEQRRIVLIKQVLNYGSKIGQIPIILWAFTLSILKKGDLNEVADSQPSDERFNNDIAAFSDQLENQVYFKNLIILIILFITLIIDLILIIRICYIKKLQQSQNNSFSDQKENVEQYKSEHAKPNNLELYNTQAQPINSQDQEIQLGIQQEMIQQQQQQQQQHQQQYQPQLSPYPLYPPPVELQQHQPIGYIAQQPPIVQMIPNQQQNMVNNYVQPQQPYGQYLPPMDQQVSGFQQGYIQPVIQQPHLISMQQHHYPFNPLGDNEPLTYPQQKNYQQ